MNKSFFLQQVKEAITEIEPDSSIILFGSRSRGDATHESDWDFLIIVNHSVNFQEVNEIRDRLYELELNTDQIISSIVRSSEEWNSTKYKYTAFYKNVISEGTVIA
ncbi:DNA polymerase beta domain-containing protein [Candidatus Magnetomorum sp. HK-1]|nr:DNA polymerase beta domain-containing protein [Candidatus Magnetomorum sp. HK-1]